MSKKWKDMPNDELHNKIRSEADLEAMPNDATHDAIREEMRQKRFEIIQARLAHFEDQIPEPQWGLHNQNDVSALKPSLFLNFAGEQLAVKFKQEYKPLRYMGFVVSESDD